MRIFPFLLIFVLAFHSQVSTSSEPSITLEPRATVAGLAQGVAEQGVIAYKGIPYAAPPVDGLRWKPPQPAQHWSDVRLFDRYGSTCMQSRAPWHRGNHKIANMSEDCLYLNVYTPTRHSPEKLPVMVWIHGGGFSWGSGAAPRLHGAGLVPQGVILVTFNYRLGPFGSFDYPGLNPSGELRGNYMLMDQLAALQWVQDNIASFGGNSDNVTVFGESAGGWSVVHLLSSPLAKDLFHKAIVQSGTFDTMSTRDIDQSLAGLPSLQDQGRYVATQLGLDGNDIARKLRQVSPEALANVTLSPFGELSYGPVVDGQLVIGHPLELWPEKIEQEVPMMIGVTSLEGVLMSLLPPAAREALLQGHDPQRLTALYDTPSPTELQRHVWEDSLVYKPTRSYLRAASIHAPSVYSYHFDYVATALRSQLAGAPHATDINYVFRTLSAAVEESALPGIQISEEDQRFSEVVSAYWVAFARTGNPNGNERPYWPNFTSSSEITLELSAPIRAQRDFLKQRLDFYSR